MASGLFLGTKFVYVGVVIYTSALLLSTAVGLPLFPAISLMGAIATALTMLGGMKAVMWSDAVQFVVMMLGIGVILGILMLPESSGEGGFFPYWQAAVDAGKVKYWDFSLDWSQLTTWSLVVCMTMAGLGSTFSDQVMMQRYFAAGEPSAVIRSFWTSSLISLPVVLTLYMVGVLLFGFYASGGHTLPEEVRSQGDRVLPYFISTELPAGLRGLVISAIVAATLSTVSSVLNSLCTATMTDFLERLKIRMPRTLSPVGLSRWITVGWGMAGTALAYYVGRFGNIIEQTQTLFGLVGGPLGGIFFLGLFTKRASASGTAVGAVCGIVATAAAMQSKTLNFMWYYPVGMAVCVAVGYTFSVIASVRWRRQ
jgi:solute:Na+ symporter, SSS family